MSPKTRERGWILVALATLGLASCATDDLPQTAEHDSDLNLTGSFIYDSGTQCSAGGATMHCCPAGYVMLGAHVDNNVFKCGQVTGFADSRASLDLFTQRNGMHACPPGLVMVGLHADQNWLACRQPAVSPIFEFVDTGTQDPNGPPMHVCAVSPLTGALSAMAGIRVDQNKFTCDF